MGKRGPKPQPTKLRLLRGNPGKRQPAKNEPRPDGLLGECPPHLAGNARKTWEAFRAQLNAAQIAATIDETALAMLCASYALYLDALENVVKCGPVWIEKGDSKIPKFAYSPHWAVMNREWKNVKQMLAEFGMTPSSRSGVQAVGGAAADNPFAAFLRKV